MPTRYQAVPLVAAPSYPSAVIWSEENLIAVASGHLVSIINPSLPCGPRGTINIPSTKPYGFGNVRKEDLLCSEMISNVLSRERRPCVRSISWSSTGMATNSGCLIAICTTEGLVKIYRPPFCDFSAEWIEVIDVSDHLYRYLLDTNFGEVLLNKIQGSLDFSEPMLKPCITERKRKRNESTLIGCDMETKETISGKTKAKKNAKSVTSIKNPENSIASMLSADQYASRSAMLSSLVVAWSPIIVSSNSDLSTPKTDIPFRYSILAVGGKSGNISFWKIAAPQCYSLEHNEIPSIALAQLLEAHKSWVNSLCFAVVRTKTILASGSSDGSAKIWCWNSGCFSIFREVLPPNYAPVSVVSLSVGGNSREIMLAVGKGSGYFDLYACDEKEATLPTTSSIKAHDYVVTGLAWSSGYLYTCAQDNCIRCWTLCCETLKEHPLPELTPNVKCSAELPDAFISCQGIAVSPTNLTLVAIRNLDIEQLNPMYQARAQRSILEFLWIGGQEANARTKSHELVHWEHNIISSLTELENSNKPLVTWDLIFSLSSFRQPFVDKTISTWLLPDRPGVSLDDALVTAYQSFATFPSRKLHVINIICRRLFLSELTFDELNGEVDFDKIVVSKGERLARWLNLFLGSEKELRERLVDATFSHFLNNSAAIYNGIPQMLQWVASQNEQTNPQLRKLARQVSRLCGKSYDGEKCGYCMAPVKFESPEVAHCGGSECENGVVQSHKMTRCGITMQLCGIEALWVCKCCNRSVKSFGPSSPKLPSQPICPFCGILLQVWQPDFMPSVMVV